VSAVGRTRSRWLATALAVAGVGCSDIATPIRNDFYEWRYIVPAGSGVGFDSLAFRWPKDRLPVRIWVEDSLDLRTNVPAAITAWRQAFLYGEFDAVVVSDSSTADVIARAGAAPGIQFVRTRLHSALAPECAGATDLDVTPDHQQLRLPVRMYIDPRSGQSDPNLASCLALTTTHELGHALGIWRHSADPTDLMFSNPEVTEPSERDMETAQILYHFSPNVEPVGP
jgi:predicted Zn-dependent protease